MTPREHAAHLEEILDARETTVTAVITIEALHPFGVENEQWFRIGHPILRVAPRVRSYSDAGCGRS